MAHTVCIILKAKQTFSPIFAHYSHLILMQIPRSCLISIFLDCVCFLLFKCACLCNFSRADKTNTMHAHRFISTAVHMFYLIHSIICAQKHLHEVIVIILIINVMFHFAPFAPFAVGNGRSPSSIWGQPGGHTFIHT